MKEKDFSIIYRSKKENFTLDKINSKIVSEMCRAYADKKYIEVKITLSSASGLKEMISESLESNMQLGDVFDLARNTSMLITYFMSVSQVVKSYESKEESGNFDIDFEEGDFNCKIKKAYKELKDTYKLTIRTR